MDRGPTHLIGAGSISRLRPFFPAAEKEREFRASAPQGKGGKRQLTPQPLSDSNLEVPPGKVLFDSEGTCSSVAKSLSHSRVPCTLAPSSIASAIVSVAFPRPLHIEEGEGLDFLKFIARSGAGTELASKGLARSHISGGCSDQSEARSRPDCTSHSH